MTRTAFPLSTQLDLSVPVGPDGTAEVPLSEEVLRLSPKRLSRVVAQLAWTLRQVPGLTRIRITSGDAPVPLPDGRRDFSVQEGDAFAPTVRDASDRLFGVDKGRIVADRPGEHGAGAGPVRPARLRAAVDRRLRRRSPGSPRWAVTGAPCSAWTQRESVRRIYEGTDVLRPTYDMFDGLWLVDRTAAGRAGPAPLRRPGLTGRRARCDRARRAGVRGQP